MKQPSPIAARARNALAMLAIPLACGPTGCSQDMAGGGFGGASGEAAFGRAHTRDGEYWTIMCAQLIGPEAPRRAAALAQALRNTRGIRAKNVYVVRKPDHSRVYYGKYLRRGNRRTGKFDMPRQLVGDAMLIKDLTNDGDLTFMESRVMPGPTADVGKPAWILRNNRAVYTLRVALFFNEPGFFQRKKAAASYCAELRGKGFDAWYRHGDFTSEVYVGSFGEDALVEKRRSGLMIEVPNDQVRALQAKETFRFELWNMNLRSLKDSAGKMMRNSQVMRVDKEADDLDLYQ